MLPKETRAAAIEAKIKLNSLIQQNEELKVQNQEIDKKNLQQREPETSQSKPEIVPDLRKEETIVVSRNFEKDVTNNLQIIDKEQIENERKTELLKIVEQESKGMKMYFFSGCAKALQKMSSSHKPILISILILESIGVVWMFV